MHATPAYNRTLTLCGPSLKAQDSMWEDFYKISAVCVLCICPLRGCGPKMINCLYDAYLRRIENPPEKVDQKLRTACQALMQRPFIPSCM